MRAKTPSLGRPWDYDSWIDALAQEEITWDKFVIDDSGSGFLEFTQNAWPSGGIEATEQFIKIFDGIIVDNGAA